VGRNPPFYRRILADVSVALRWQELGDDVHALVNAVRHFAGTKAPLVARSFAFGLFHYGGAPSSLGGKPLAGRVLATLANSHGAPLYQQLVNGDAATLKLVVDGHLEKIKAMGKLQGRSAAEVEAEITPEIRERIAGTAANDIATWANDAGRTVLLYIHALLHQRGRCHRKLLHLVQELEVLFRSTGALDMAFGMPTNPKTASQMPREIILAGQPLTGFVSWYLLDVMESVLRCLNELDLITKPEMSFRVFWDSVIAQSRLEIVPQLYCAAGVKEAIAKAKAAPLGAQLRTVAPMPDSEYVRCEVMRSLSQATFTAAAALGKEITEVLKQKPDSLQSLECVWDHRIAVFSAVSRPAYVDAKEISRNRELFERDVDKALANAAQMFRSVGAVLATYKKDPNFITTPFLEAAGKSAKMSEIAIGLLLNGPFKTASGAAAVQAAKEQYVVDFATPFDPSQYVVQVRLAAKKK